MVFWKIPLDCFRWLPIVSNYILWSYVLIFRLGFRYICFVINFIKHNSIVLWTGHVDFVMSLIAYIIYSIACRMWKWKKFLLRSYILFSISKVCCENLNCKKFVCNRFVFRHWSTIPLINCINCIIANISII